MKNRESAGSPLLAEAQMKKIIIILLALLTAVFIFSSCQKTQEAKRSKEQQTQKDEISRTLPSKDQTISALEKSKQMSDECQKIWAKRPKFSRDDKEILWKTCRIPWAETPGELSDILEWWKDEDGYEDIMSTNFWYRVRGDWEKIKAIEPLKNMALNSKYQKLRFLAVLSLHDIDKKKFIPLFKEVLKKEVEERGVTKEARGSEGVVSATGEILAEEGEYEFAFPYLMKAKIFRMSYLKKDEKAAPFARRALNDKDEKIRLEAAGSLVAIGNEADKKTVLGVLGKILETSDRNSSYRDSAIYILGELRDKDALPILKKALTVETGYVRNNILKAIKKIEEGPTKQR
jgi:hypothetical protein